MTVTKKENKTTGKVGAVSDTEKYISRYKKGFRKRLSKAKKGEKNA